MDVRWDSIPYEEFVVAIKYAVESPHQRLLPPEHCLRDLYIHGKTRPRVGAEVQPIELWFVTESDPFLEEAKTFIILRTTSENREMLIREAFRLQRWLRSRRIPTIFRIDPQFGLVHGSFHEPVVPRQAADFPRLLIVMVVTDDPGHPEVALQDYVIKSYRQRYITLFEKYNRRKPGALKVLGVDISRLFRRAKSVATHRPDFLTYAFLQDLFQELVQRLFWFDLTVSMIFSNVAEEEIQQTVFSTAQVHVSSGTPLRFFTSIDELIRQDEYTA